MKNVKVTRLKSFAGSVRIDRLKNPILTAKLQVGQKPRNRAQRLQKRIVRKSTSDLPRNFRSIELSK